MNVRCLFGHRWPPRPSGVQYQCTRRGCREFVVAWRFD